MTPRWVVDTNVVVAGLITQHADAATAQWLDRMLSGRLAHVVSLALLNEYERVLLRPGLAKLHGLRADEVEQLVAGLARHAQWVEPPAGALVAPDPGDQHLWNLLQAADDLLLVSGDKRLFTEPAMAGRVLTPAQAINRL